MNKQPIVKDNSSWADFINLFLFRPVYRKPKKEIDFESELIFVSEDDEKIIYTSDPITAVKSITYLLKKHDSCSISVVCDSNKNDKATITLKKFNDNYEKV